MHLRHTWNLSVNPRRAPAWIGSRPESVLTVRTYGDASDHSFRLDIDGAPRSGNLWLAGQQIWLGPAMTGRTVRLWAGLDRVHVLLDGYRIKTLPSRLDARDLARLAAAGACPAGPPPLPAASVDVIEVERTVNASGNVSLGNQMISAGLPLAGQRITLRLDGPASNYKPG